MIGCSTSQVAPITVSSTSRSAPRLPRTWRRLYEVCSAGRTQDALALHRKLIPLLDLAFALVLAGALGVVFLMDSRAPASVSEPSLGRLAHARRY